MESGARHEGAITDICRIDYRLTKDNELYLLEINSVPRLSTNTNTVLMAQINNMSFDELLKKHEQSIIDSYDLVVTDTEIYVTERVNNIWFVK